MSQIVRDDNGASQVTNVSRYQYQKLEQPDHIRCLTLLDITEDGVSCRIHHVPVSQGGYQALSYVWGAPEQLFQAIVKDIEGRALGFIPLTSNLNSALRDLLAAEKLVDKTFWIDQICIDQESPEKNHQIPMMGQIYKNAERVVTYVGPSVDENLEDKGIQLVAKLYDHFSPTYSMLHQTPPRELAHVLVDYDAPIFTTEMKTAISEEEWQWLVALCFGEWTRRLWLYQEQRLNYKIVMLRGHRLIPWNAVAILALFFALDWLPVDQVVRFWLANRISIPDYPIHHATTLFDAWRIWMSNKNLESRGGRLPTLRQNLYTCRHLRCLEPKDRIFGVLAVSSDITTLSITFDYSEPASKLFHQLSIIYLQRDSDLGLLSDVCSTDNLSVSNCPSWALSVPRSKDSEGVAILRELYRPHPRGTLKTRPRIIADNSVLALRGRIIDRISFSSPRISYSLIAEKDAVVAESAHENMCILEGVSQFLLEIGINPHNITMLCQAVIAKTSWRPATEDYVFHFWCFIQYFAARVTKLIPALSLDFGERMSQLNPVFSKVEALLRETSVDESSSREPAMKIDLENGAYIWSQTLLINRCLCITDQKRIITVQNPAKKGDVVAVFEGSDRPYTLRPTSASMSETRYQLIGDAYVHNVMHGELYAGVDPNEVDYDIEII